ncbi:MAG TPA: hypothetical protein PLI51_10345, partial [bacterium]|nr:hypothetical protein [bacterium]HPQ67114.1 hypothetical protein [bacterium]
MKRFLSFLGALGFVLTAGTAGAAEWVMVTDLAYSLGPAHIAPLDATHFWATVEDTVYPPFGRIYFFDGADWTLQTALFGAQTGDFKALCAAAADDVWAVGETFEGGPVRHGMIFHYDGFSWELQTEVVSSVNYSQLESVSAVDTEEVWVGGTGVILHTTDGGATWSVSTDTGSNQFWTAVAALDSTRIWAGGASNPCEILLGDGTGWTVQTDIALGSSRYLRGLDAISETDVWAVTDLGYIFYYDGASWSVSTRVTEAETVNSGPVAGMNGNAVWAGPNDNVGGIYFFDGLSWSRQTRLGGSYNPEDLAIAGRTVWAGTERCRIYSYTVPSATPSPVPSPTPSPFYVVQDWTLSTQIAADVISVISAGGDDDVWVPSTYSYSSSVGNIYHFDGASWSLSTSAFTAETGQFRGVFALDADHAWVCGETRSPSAQGRVYGWDGGDWNLQTQTFGVSYIYDAYAADSANIWACGSTGIILRSTDGGSTWTRETNLGSYYVVSISGVDVDNVWAVARWTTQSSRIYYSNAGTWTLDTIVAYEESGRYLRDVCANTQTDVWAAGDGGLILHRGESGEWELSEDVGETTIQALISAHDAHNVWAGFGGEDAGIYYYDGTRWARVQGADSTCYGLDARAPSTVWAVTSSYRVWKFDRPSPTPFGYKTPTPTPSAT